MIVGMKQQRHVGPRGLVGGKHVRDIDVEQRVTVDDERTRFDQVQARKDRPCRASRSPSSTIAMVAPNLCAAKKARISSAA